MIAPDHGAREQLSRVSPDVAAEIRIGCSGWHYKHWRGPFYPEKLPSSKWLGFYVERFNTVELNSTFYRLPPEGGLRTWRESTPPDFLFAAKGSRFITHMKKLTDPQPSLARYFERVGVLGDKLGPVLFQLPPWWEVNVPRLQEFLEAAPPAHRYGFEFRHESWHCEEVYKLLRRHNVAFCAFDIAQFHSPVVVTADFAYVRLHGPGPGPYQGSYSIQALQVWARRIRRWAKELKAVYVYFDNDMAAFAPHNALELKRLCGCE
jgi:uncharacterized protein YecE (DUF72 family)